MKNTWIEYGRNFESDLIHVSTVKSGKTDLLCPYCESLLVAKKGNVMSHHFAHISDTCNPYRKPESELIPLYSCFPIQLTGSEHEAIKMSYKAYQSKSFNDRGGQGSFAQLMFYSKIRCPPEKLIKKGLFKEDSKGKYTVTELGKLCAGGLTMVDFHSLQLELFKKKKNDLSKQIKTTFGDENNYLKTEYDIFTKAVSRLRESSLYFLEIKTKEVTLHKIGITSRKIEERLKEIRVFLKKQLEDRISIKVLYNIPHLGRIERFFKVMHQSNLSSLQKQEEYFLFDKTELKKIIEELEAISKLPKDRGGTRKNSGRKSPWPDGTELKTMRMPASLEVELKAYALKLLLKKSRNQ